MNYDLGYWTDYFKQDMETNFDVNKKMLKVLMVNQKSDDALFAYYNFDNFNELTAFIKMVILPSLAISTLLYEYDNIIAGAMSYENTIEKLNSFEDKDHEIEKKYKEFYIKLDKLEKSEIDIPSLLELTEEINIAFSPENMVFLILEFSDCLKTYLEDIYFGYKNSGKIEELKETLSETDFDINKLKSFIDDINGSDIDEIEDFLYQIAVI